MPLAVALAMGAATSVPLRADADDEVLRADAIDVQAKGGPVQVYEPEPVEKQVIGEAELEALPGVDPSLAVATLPGFRTQQRIQGQKAAVSIEGLPAEYTLILVNGQRYTGTVGGVGDLTDVPLTNVERIEVQRGSQALRQGSEAGGGVISIVPRDAPEAGVELRARGGAGNYDHFVGMLTGGARIGPAGLTFSYTRDQESGYDRRGSGFAFTGIGGRDSTFVVDDYYARVVSDVGDAVELHGELGWRVRQDDYVGQGAFAGDPLGDQTTHRVLGGGGASWRATDSLDLGLDVFYYGDRVRDTVARDAVLDEYEVRIEPNADVFFSTGAVDHALTLGLDLRYAQLELETGSIEFVPVAPYDQLESLTYAKEDTSNGALFVEWEAAVVSWLDLLAGVRAQFDTRFEPSYTPQVALLARPHSALSLRAQVGLSRRAPSLVQMYQPETAQNGGSYFLLGNDALVPERASSFRLGFEWQPRSDAVFSATGFFNDIEDHIRALRVGASQVGTTFPCTGVDCDDFTLPAICAQPGTEQLPVCQPPVRLPSPILKDVLQYENLQDVMTAGVEVQAFVQPHELFDLRLGYTFMATHVDYPERPSLTELPNEPKHVLGIVARARTPRIAPRVGRVELGVDVRYRSSALFERSGTGFASFTSTDRTDPSWVVDARLTLPFLEDDRVALYLDAFNLTNEVTVDSYEIRGRSFFAGVRVELGGQPRFMQSGPE